MCFLHNCSNKRGNSYLNRYFNSVEGVNKLKKSDRKNIFDKGLSSQPIVFELQKFLINL